MGKRRAAQEPESHAGNTPERTTLHDTRPSVRRYAPSWFDRLIEWCGSQSVPAWAIYTLWLIAQGILAHVGAWEAGMLPLGSFNFLLAFCGIWVFEIVLFSHYLDVIARESLAEYRPMLKNLSREAFEQMQYEFTNLPPRPVLWISLVGFAMGVLMGHAARAYQPIMFAWPLVTYSFWGLSWSVLMVFSYRVIRQLRFVSRIYAMTEEINLYYLKPLYALSRLAVWTSLSLAIITDVNMVLFAPELLVTPAFITVVVLAMLLAVATFLMPMVGIKRRILAEKNRLMAETGQAIEVAYDRLAQAIQSGDSKNLADIRTLLDLVHRKKDYVHAIPVWPWNPGTFTALVSAIILPIFLGILSRVMQRVLGL